MPSRARWIAAMIGAILIHAGLFASIHFTHVKRTITAPNMAASDPKPVVHAKAVDAKAVEQEVARLNAEEAKAIATRKKQQRDFENALARAKAARAKEARRQQALKKQNEQLKKKTAEINKQHTQKVAKMQQKLKQLDKISKNKNEQLKSLAKQEQKLKQDITKNKKIAQKNKKEVLLQQKLAQEQAINEAHNQYLDNEIKKYTAMIRSRVTHNLLWQGRKDLVCLMTVQMAPDGHVTSVAYHAEPDQVAYCQAAERAVYKASPLPVPESPEVFNAFRKFMLTLKAKELL